MPEKSFFKKPNFRDRATRDFLLIFVGAVIQAVALHLFLIPSNLAVGGVSGIAQIINHYTGWPIGVMVVVGNVPLFVLGWRYLGGARFAYRTIFAVLVYSVAVDLLGTLWPTSGITDDLLLNALYGALISGLGYALVYRGQGTSGGTDILARILVHFRGIPLSQTYLLTDVFTMILAGLAFDWERALYSIMILYISGVAAETVTQGSRVVRTAMIITKSAEAVSQGILHGLGRGLTKLTGEGMYTGEERAVLYCVISRAEVERLKALVAEVDPKAFVVIGHAYEALGEGFQDITSS
ncbi:MAG TPA: YitT family protein [Anaerolineales bacterium]|nr:YitT family protein [Anaerolineales bacterium]